MSSPEHVKRVGDLEIVEDLDFQERVWRVQRWGQLLVVLFVLAGLIGLFGGGLWGREQSSDSSGRLQITHPRFARALAAYDMEWKIAPELAADGQVVVWLDDSLLDGLQVEMISPQPQLEEIAEGRIIFHFTVGPTNEPVALHFHLQTQRPGRGEGRAGVSGGPEVRITHFIYP